MKTVDELAKEATKLEPLDRIDFAKYYFKAGHASRDEEIAALKKDAKLSYEEVIAKREVIKHKNGEIENLEKQIAVLEEASKLCDCRCSIKERISGHLIDCWMPEVNKALEKLAEIRGSNKEKK